MVETAVVSRRKLSCQGPRHCDWSVSQRAAGWLSVAVCAAAEPARFARRRTRRASPRFSSRTESPMSAPLPRRGARKPICLPKIMFVVARVPSTLVPAFTLRAERRMKPGRHETVQSAIYHTSPPFFSGPTPGCHYCPERLGPFCFLHYLCNASILYYALLVLGGCTALIISQSVSLSRGCAGTTIAPRGDLVPSLGCRVGDGHGGE